MPTRAIINGSKSLLVRADLLSPESRNLECGNGPLLHRIDIDFAEPTQLQMRHQFRQREARPPTGDMAGEPIDRSQRAGIFRIPGAS